MSDSGRASDDVSVVVRRRWDHLSEAELSAWIDHFRARVARPEMTVMVARDQDGGALAVLAAAVDDSVCAIGFAVATRHEARWALHDHLVRILIDRGVRCLLAADEGLFGALGYPTAVQQYQHLLGYELRHVIPSSPRPPARRLRLIASVVLATAAAASIIVPRAAGSTSTHVSRDGAMQTPADHVCQASRGGASTKRSGAHPRISTEPRPIRDSYGL
jgi:hypothetical protein